VQEKDEGDSLQVYEKSALLPGSGLFFRPESDQLDFLVLLEILLQRGEALGAETEFLLDAGVRIVRIRQFLEEEKDVELGRADREIRVVVDDELRIRPPHLHRADGVDNVLFRERLVEIEDPGLKIVVDADDTLTVSEHGRKFGEVRPECKPVDLSRKPARRCRSTAGRREEAEGPLFHHIDRAVVVAVIAVGMMEATIDDVVDMITVWNCLVSATRTMNVTVGVFNMLHVGAATGVFLVNGENVLVDRAVLILMVEVAVVDIVDMALVANRGVAAALTMFMVFVGDVRFTHDASSYSSHDRAPILNCQSFGIICASAPPDLLMNRSADPQISEDTPGQQMRSRQG